MSETQVEETENENDRGLVDVDVDVAGSVVTENELVDIVKRRLRDGDPNVQEATSVVAVALDAQQTLTREYAADLEAGDGRTILGCCVPYGKPATVSDDGRTSYQEVFMPNSVTNAPGRMDMYLNFEHQPGLGGIVGRAIELDDRPDGLYGKFRALDHSDADKALELLREKVLTGMSIEFRSLKHRIVDGVVQRLRVHIDRVSLCRWPAYQDAQILAVRSEPVTVEPVTMPDELAAKLARVGVELIYRVTVVRETWDGSPTRFTDDEYQRSCLIDRGGILPVKERCSLAVLEPGGELNVNAIKVAAATLGGSRGGLSGVSTPQRRLAAQKLVRFYRLAEMEAPDSIRRLAAG